MEYDVVMVDDGDVVAAVDDDDDAVFLSPNARHQRWQSKRPRIDHLKVGVATVDDGGRRLPLFDVGDRIVVEVRTRFLHGMPWLHTVVGRVRSIDDEAGVVSLLDEDSDARSPVVRWASFNDPLFDFRLAPAQGDPFSVTISAPKPDATSLPHEGGGPARRGRPKGSKNRPKAVIAAEKEARATRKQGKVA